MIETELKIFLDAGAEARLLRHPDLETTRLEPRRSETLVSIYFDTEDHALAAAGIALRLRKVGRRWVQTIKVKPRGPAGHGLFANREIERPAPGGRLVLEGDEPEYAAIAEAVGSSELIRVFETRVKRVTELLAAPGGGEVELAIDRGEIVAGEKTAPILEAELELKAGDVGAVYALAASLFTEGPVRFANANKSARGYALARTGVADKPLAARMAGKPDYDGSASVESVAGAVLRDCFAQIAGNMVVVADSEAVEGPHQLRVGLRRLRTALGVFSPSLGGGQALAGLNDGARRLGQLVSGLRDLDVLIEDVARLAALGLDDAARDALVAALRARREIERAEVRAALASAETVAFVFDLGRFIEARGWLEPADYSQTARLARPIREVAPGILSKRHRKAMRLGRGVEQFDDEALHTLRKELKKLRYAADMLGTIFGDRKVAGYLRTLKDLQNSFGSLTDAAMAEHWLSGEQAPGRDNPAAQRATGWALGTLLMGVTADRPGLFARWEKLTRAKHFWG